MKLLCGEVFVGNFVMKMGVCLVLALASQLSVLFSGESKAFDKNRQMALVDEIKLSDLKTIDAFRSAYKSVEPDTKTDDDRLEVGNKFMKTIGGFVDQCLGDASDAWRLHRIEVVQLLKNATVLGKIAKDFAGGALFGANTDENRVELRKSFITAAAVGIGKLETLFNDAVSAGNIQAIKDSFDLLENCKFLGGIDDMALAKYKLRFDLVQALGDFSNSLVRLAQEVAGKK